jgi:hypothetical protein
LKGGLGVTLCGNWGAGGEYAYRGLRQILDEARNAVNDHCRLVNAAATLADHPLGIEWARSAGSAFIRTFSWLLYPPGDFQGPGLGVQFSGEAREDTDRSRREALSRGSRCQDLRRASRFQHAVSSLGKLPITERNEILAIYGEFRTVRLALEVVPLGPREMSWRGYNGDPVLVCRRRYVLEER